MTTVQFLAYVEHISCAEVEKSVESENIASRMFESF